MPELQCSQCGSDIRVVEDDFLHCDACDAALFINTRHLLLHNQIHPRLTRKELAGHLRRWLHQHEIPGSPTQLDITLQWWPMWEITVARQRQLLLAATSPWPEWEQLDLSAGQRTPFDPNCDGEIIFPERSIAAVQQTAEADITTLRLLHLPFYLVNYQLNGQTWQVYIDALKGIFYAEDLPQPVTKQLDASHRKIFILTTLVFLGEGLISPSPGWTMLLYGITGVVLYHGCKHYLREHIHD